MTFARLIELAQFGSAMDKYSTNVEYVDIHDFAKTWYKLAQLELDDIRLIDKSDECVYREYRK